MLYFYSGTDTEKVRATLDRALTQSKAAEVVRITDAHSVADLHAALLGGGMFSVGKRVVVLDSVLENIEMSELIMPLLPKLAESDEAFVLVASEVNAATRKAIEKHAEKCERFDHVKQKKEETIFALANALQNKKKKDLWVGYHKELHAGKSPESIHGVLFWAAKQQLLRNPRDEYAKKLIIDLAELPHEARRSGFDMEYALERFVLSIAPAPYQNQRNQ